MPSAKTAQEYQGLIVHPLSPCGTFTTGADWVGLSKALTRRELSDAIIARCHTEYTTGAL